MKALVTALALLSFVAASTIPVAAHAATKTEMSSKKKSTKKHVKKTSKKSTKKKAKMGQSA
jgi:Ni/Co efflux regulator RcnB